MLMREQPASIILGARILQRAVGARRTVIAIEDQMGAVHAGLAGGASTEAEAAEIDIVKVTTIYPEGGEKQLVQVLTGLEVPSGGRPTDLGLLCQNVATATAVARAVTEGKPLVERIVTVTGNGVRRPRNLLAPIGTPISEPGRPVRRLCRNRGPPGAGRPDDGLSRWPPTPTRSSRRPTASWC